VGARTSVIAGNEKADALARKGICKNMYWAWTSI
jgi:hypothetical protein